MRTLKSGALRVLCLIWLVAAVAVVSHSQQLTADAAPAPVLVMPAKPAATFQVSEPAPARRVVDKKFVIMSALVMGLTISDLERTQHCLARGTCVEMNPMLPHSRAGMYAVNIPINAATMYLGYRLKSAGRRSWLLAPALVAAGHLVGTGVRF